MRRVTVLIVDNRNLPNGSLKGACWCVIVLNRCLFACHHSEAVRVCVCRRDTGVHVRGAETEDARGVGEVCHPHAGPRPFTSKRSGHKRKTLIRISGEYL